MKQEIPLEIAVSCQDYQKKNTLINKSVKQNKLLIQD